MTCCNKKKYKITPIRKIYCPCNPEKDDNLCPIRYRCSLHGECRYCADIERYYDQIIDHGTYLECIFISDSQNDLCLICQSPIGTIYHITKIE